MRTCEIEGCDRKHEAKGMCQKHYMSDYYAKHYQPVPPKPPRLCEVEGCENRHDARGYCKSHYGRYQRGTLDPNAPRGRPNAKLNAEKVREVWKLLEQGWSQAQIARHFRVSDRAIWAVANGKTWKHVVSYDGDTPTPTGGTTHE